MASVTRPADRVGVVLDVRREQRRRGDAQREPVHQRVDLDGLTVVQAIRQVARRIDHRRRVARDALAVEGGLDEPPLREVQRLVAGQQPHPEQPPHALQPAAFGDVVAASRQDDLDELGVVDEPEASARHAPRRDRPVLPRHVGQERRHAGEIAGRGELANGRQGRRAGRVRAGSHRS